MYYRNLHGTDTSIGTVTKVRSSTAGVPSAPAVTPIPTKAYISWCPACNIKFTWYLWSLHCFLRQKVLAWQKSGNLHSWAPVRKLKVWIWNSQIIEFDSFSNWNDVLMTQTGFQLVPTRLNWDILASWRHHPVIAAQGVLYWDCPGKKPGWLVS